MRTKYIASGKTIITISCRAWSLQVLSIKILSAKQSDNLIVLETSHAGLLTSAYDCWSLPRAESGPHICQSHRFLECCTWKTWMPACTVDTQPVYKVRYSEYYDVPVIKILAAWSNTSFTKIHIRKLWLQPWREGLIFNIWSKQAY